MKIGIIGAMEEEVKILRENLSEPLSWERAGALFISGSLGNHEVIVVRSGIGKVLASHYHKSVDPTIRREHGDQYRFSWRNR